MGLVLGSSVGSSQRAPELYRWGSCHTPRTTAVTAVLQRKTAVAFRKQKCSGICCVVLKIRMRSLNQKAASCTKSLGKTAMQRYASPVHVDIVARSPLLPVAAGCLWSEEGMAKDVLPALHACRESAGDGGVCVAAQACSAWKGSVRWTVPGHLSVVIVLSPRGQRL